MDEAAAVYVVHLICGLVLYSGIVNAHYARCTSAGGKRVRTRTYRAGAGAHAQQWPCKLLLSPESGRKLCCCLSDNYSRFSSLSWSISLTLWTASHFKFKQLWRHIPVRRRLRTIAAPFQRYCSELEPLGRSAKRRSAVRSTLGGPRHLVHG